MSGNNTDSIYKIKVLSSNMINGGNFGPEGGLVVTILLVSSILLVNKFIPNRGSHYVTF